MAFETSCRTAPFVVAPHIPVIDKSTREDGIFSFGNRDYVDGSWCDPAWCESDPLVDRADAIVVT